MGNSPRESLLTKRESFRHEEKPPARTKASLLEGGGTALAVTEGVKPQSLEKLELMKNVLMQEYLG